MGLPRNASGRAVASIGEIGETRESSVTRDMARSGMRVRLRRYLLAVAVIWTGFVGGLMIWGILDQHRTVQALAMNEASSLSDFSGING